MGKGSTRRPQQINDEILELRWQLIFEVDTDREKEQLLNKIETLEKELHEPSRRRS